MYLQYFMNKKFIIITAMGKNGEIGVNKENHFDLPKWNLPNDTKRFTKIIRGNVIIVGNNTFQAILGQTKKPSAIQRLHNYCSN